MASPYLSNPMKVPRTGPPVQNMGGFALNTAPLFKRPVASPGVRRGLPGPAPGMPQPGTPGGVMIGAPRPAPGLPIQRPGAPQPIKSPGVGVVSPTPVVAPGAPPPAPAAPAPAPAAAAPPAGAPAAPGGVYGRSGGTVAEAGSLEDQIRKYITGAMGGVTSKAFIDRAKSQLGSAVEGQRASAVRRIDDDAIKRGLFRGGQPAELAAAAGTSAQGALSSGIADILSKAEQQDIAGRESAAGTAGNLLNANRSWDEQELARQEAAAARAAAGRPRTFTYIDPDDPTGTPIEMDEAWF